LKAHFFVRDDDRLDVRTKRHYIFEVAVLSTVMRGDEVGHTVKVYPKERVLEESAPTSFLHVAREDEAVRTACDERDKTEVVFVIEAKRRNAGSVAEESEAGVAVVICIS
jgi:hypothetical protein